MPPDTVAVAVPRSLDVTETEIDTDSGFVLLHWAVSPLQLPTQFHLHAVVVSATSSRVPAAQPFSMVLLQLPFVAGVTVHVALVGLLQVVPSHVNVAEPERQDDPSVRLMLKPELVVVALAEQRSQFSIFPRHTQSPLPVQDCVISSAGLGRGQLLMLGWSGQQVTLRVRIL